LFISILISSVYCILFKQYFFFYIIYYLIPPVRTRTRFRAILVSACFLPAAHRTRKFTRCSPPRMLLLLSAALRQARPLGKDEKRLAAQRRWTAEEGISHLANFHRPLRNWERICRSYSGVNLSTDCNKHPIAPK